MCVLQDASLDSRACVCVEYGVSMCCVGVNEFVCGVGAYVCVCGISVCTSMV